MRAKLTYKVFGSTHAEIVRRAWSVLADYYELEVEELKSKVDVELEVEHLVPSDGVVSDGKLESFVGTVHVRFR